MDADQGGGVRTYHCHIRGQATRGGCGAGYVRKRRKRVRCIGRVQGARGSAGGGGLPHTIHTPYTRVFVPFAPNSPFLCSLSLLVFFAFSLPVYSHLSSRLLPVFFPPPPPTHQSHTQSAEEKTQTVYAMGRMQNHLRSFKHR